jgi:hypothetical protein
VGTILFRARLSGGQLRARTSNYARALDASLAFYLGSDAWQRTLTQVRSDGSFSRATALQLFALAYAPLPGTRAPAGRRGRIEDGGIAADAILSIWSSLTPAQRRAAGKALGVTGVRAGRHTRRVQARAELGDPAFERDPVLQLGADRWVPVYAAKLHRQLTLQIVAGRTETPHPTSDTALADALPVDVGGVWSDQARYCRIRLLPAGLGLAPDRLRLVLAHEVFHCFQFSIMTPTRAARTPSWLIEGSADWAAQVVTHAPWSIAGGWLERYVETPDTPLFERTYDATGFFGHSEETLGDLFSRIIPILLAGDNYTRFLDAGGNGSQFLDSWAVSTFNFPQLGPDFVFHDPNTPPDWFRVKPNLVFGSGFVVAHPYTFEHYRLFATDGDREHPFVHFQIFSGHARLADRHLDTTDLSDAYFCLTGHAKDCECPKDTEGIPPPAPPLGDDTADLGLSSGSETTQGFVSIESLDQYCKAKQKQPRPVSKGRPIGPVGGNGFGCSTGCGFSGDDPHLTTFDGAYYDFQGAGEFTLVRSNSGDLEVQVREQPFGHRLDMAVDTALAIRVAGDRVLMSAGSYVPSVRVNGQGFLVTASGVKLPHGGRIRVIPSLDQLEVSWPDGSLLRVWELENSFLNVLLKPAASRQGKLSGMLGNFNGDPNDDFKTRSGRRLDSAKVQASLPLLYRVFGDSWRISQRRSLFDYRPGQSTRTFTDRSFPSQLVTAEKLSRTARERAIRVCRAMKLRDAHIRAACIVDVGRSGDYEFARGAGLEQHTVARFGKPHSAGTGGGQPAAGPWNVLSTIAPNESLVTPALVDDGGAALAAYQTGEGSIDEVEFTPGVHPSQLARWPVITGWKQVGKLSWIGGPTSLQLLVDGIHSGSISDPLDGISVFTRKADGSFATPTPVTSSFSSRLGGSAVRASDGQPVWASDVGFKLWHGSASVDASALAPGTISNPSLRQDSSGRTWLAWYRATSSDATSGLYLAQINATTLAPVGQPRRAPQSATIWNTQAPLGIACAQTCRIAYHQESAGASNRILSWSYDDAKPTLVATVAGGDLRGAVVAAYTPGHHLWIAWWDGEKSRYEGVRGNESGAGGTVRTLGRPSTSPPGQSATMSAVATDERLTLLVNWAPSPTRRAIYTQTTEP